MEFMGVGGSIPLPHGGFTPATSGVFLGPMLTHRRDPTRQRRFYHRLHGIKILALSRSTNGRHFLRWHWRPSD
jgi:hypothetical protein